MKEKRLQKLSAPQTVEVWGGVECTVNRVGNKYYDQLVCNGHSQRLEDLDLFASLGLRTLRYPILWENVAPESLEHPDWSWTDERLDKMKSLHIEPIVGLLHHGSGPRYTSLDDPLFPEKFAAFAKMVAQRYPFLKLYNPINEPLTTARFSGLYGLWYPHTKDAKVFARMMVNQCKGIILAMKEIRKIQPQAQLIQTEDLGQTQSTARLAYQAEFENERRWLTFDLLSGKVDKHHMMWKYFISLGIKKKDMNFFIENSCPPDVIGINHYLTSERYLDHKVEFYPEHMHGGNGRHQYVDVETVRVAKAECIGIRSLLKQTWKRYHLPVAITEVHLGCTREEQMRWFYQVWTTAKELKSQGINMKAVTAWSLLGAYDWDSLLTRHDKHYEPGVFDLRASEPRPTALAGLIKEIISKGSASHPVLNQPGWWQRPERFTYRLKKNTRSSCGRSEGMFVNGNRQQPLIITGATGTLGKALAKVCMQRGIYYKLLSRNDLDIADPRQAEAVIRKLNPWAVINTAGYVRVAQAESEAERCYRENLNGAVNLAEVCKELDIPFVTFSSDLVFGGKRDGFYTEGDQPCAQGIYGASKAAAENMVQRVMPKALIIRTSAFFGPWDEYNFIISALRAFESRNAFQADAHVHVSPTYVPDLAHASLDLLLDGARGIWHLTSEGKISWAELAKTAAIAAGFDQIFVEKWYRKQVEACAHQTPVSTALVSTKGYLMPSLNSAIERFIRESEFLSRQIREAGKDIPVKKIIAGS